MFNVKASEMNKISYESYNRIVSEIQDQVGQAILDAANIGEFHTSIFINKNYIDMMIDHLQSLDYVAEVRDSKIHIDW